MRFAALPALLFLLVTACAPAAAPAGNLPPAALQPPVLGESTARVTIDEYADYQ